jgi:polysaccharide deacetylase family protein (PEP-CTERM system associated)
MTERYIDAGPASPPITNILTIDVEEYFHPTEVQMCVPREQWAILPSRLLPEMRELLSLLSERRVKATFFVLGWVAERMPNLVREIVDEGHEIGCHSHLHALIYELTAEQFRRDTNRAVIAIQDASGVTPRAYRAPSYSITKRSIWALEILVECGFTFDSSIYPIAHDRYGIAEAYRYAHVVQTAAGPITEVPIATVKLPNGRVAPIGGGGYLRLLPYRYTAAGIRRLNSVERQPACVYFHPWEIDPKQPRLTSGMISRLRTYTGLGGMRRKLEKLLADFAFRPLMTTFGEDRGRDLVHVAGEGLRG